MNAVARDVVRIGIAVVLLISSLSAGAQAQSTSEKGASIVAYPKVLADGTRDTVIQITNTSDSLRRAHCYYTNAAALWQVTDFIVKLTAQQPAYWVVSRGRTLNELCGGDPICGPIDPGAVPPVSTPFEGELLCVEVDAADLPIPGNALVGEATLKDGASGDAAKYNAVGLRGFDTNNGDTALCLGGDVSGSCPNGAEYEACPEAWILNHVAEGAQDPLIGANSTMHTDLTVVPCAHDFETQAPQTVTLEFLITNEFESLLSTVTTVTCWENTPLIAINPVFNAGMLGTTYAQTRIKPVQSSGAFLIVAQEFHDSLAPAVSASAGVNAHVEGAHADGDLIVVPSPF